LLAILVILVLIVVLSMFDPNRVSSSSRIDNIHIFH
jgi:hypothetical protein